MAQESPNRTYRGNMMVIQFGYDNAIVLPMEDGQALLTLMANAESYRKDYGKDPVIEPMSKDLTITFIARTIYERCKLGFLEITNGTD